MMDLGLDNVKYEEDSGEVREESESQKIEIPQDIIDNFGEEVTELVEGVSKLSGIKFKVPETK